MSYVGKARTSPALREHALLRLVADEAGARVATELGGAGGLEARAMGVEAAAPIPAPPWHVTQSRSVWQLTHAFRFRSASKPWCAGVTGASLQSDFGGWKRPASRTPCGPLIVMPSRMWQVRQKLCSWWQAVHFCVAIRASIGCIEM